MWNDSNNMAYIKKDRIRNRLPTLLKPPLPVDRTNEYILTAIRTKEGIAVQRLIHEFNYPPIN